MYPIDENMSVGPNQKKMDIIMRIQFSLIWWMNIDFKGNGGNKSISCKTKSWKLCTQREECVYSIQSLKEWRLLRESKFVQVKGWTLILRKIVERKLFLANPNIKTVYPNEKNLSIVPNHQKNEDYHKNLSLSYFMDEVWF